MSDTEIVNVTITAPDADWLRQHCEMLVEQRLAASANIIASVESIYRWQDEILHTEEAHATLRTQRKHFDEIARLTNKAHPYETVHILATATLEADNAYAEWVRRSTHLE